MTDICRNALSFDFLQFLLQQFKVILDPSKVVIKMFFGVKDLFFSISNHVLGLSLALFHSINDVLPGLGSFLELRHQLHPLHQLGEEPGRQVGLAGHQAVQLVQFVVLVGHLHRALLFSVIKTDFFN